MLSEIKRTRVDVCIHELACSRVVQCTEDWRRAGRDVNPVITYAIGRLIEGCVTRIMRPHAYYKSYDQDIFQALKLSRTPTYRQISQVSAGLRRACMKSPAGV